MNLLDQADARIEELVGQARAGSLPSFERIVELHKDRLFTYLLQILRNDHDAEDAAQETFIKAYRNLHLFDGRARFLTWLYTIAKNTAFTQLRKRKVQHPVEDFQDILTAPPPAIDPNEADAIWTIARRLKPKQYETLWLFYAEGFSLKEVAAIMKTNPITLRVNLHRARTALGRELVRQGHHR